ncbi:gag-pol polyprotein [Striga asiatica]|uniref:Gag-pol polyprotein n=1 Tax=Striga asiatica TaxID=4170 RepID=A0A5A7PTK1_STRAF|nr:gag-pol polyprotein [Striga asiatica]
MIPARPGAATGSELGQGGAPARVAGSGGPYQRALGGGRQQLSPVAARAVARLRCFGCGEMGHRQAVCPKGAATRALFTEDVGDYVTGEDYLGSRLKAAASSSPAWECRLQLGQDL